MGERVELLAPAGSYEAFLGAVNAGADAVYLGGQKFGARAYADNFTREEIIRALRLAHFYGKRIYLTVNTLLKEREMAVLSEHLAPFYEAGLDGVVCSPLEAGMVHEACGAGFLTVTPGVRFADGDVADQVRVTTPARAREIGSDFIVVGRPITAAADPVAAYRRCVAEFAGE